MKKLTCPELCNCFAARQAARYLTKLYEVIFRTPSARAGIE
jgi:hypothetical protein